MILATAPPIAAIMPADKPRRLGRGLDALLSVRPSTEPHAAPAEEGPYRTIPLNQIRPNPYQPRREFDAAELEELQLSLKQSGLLQPITVRPSPSGDGFELIAGERRLRAASKLGWQEIPAAVRSIDDRGLLTLALVENLQRADLNPLEEAQGYQRLVQEFGLTQQAVADLVGKDRSSVSNTLRLLSLPASVQELVSAGQLTMGHARALLAVENEQAQSSLARRVVDEGLSVRDMERLAQATKQHDGGSKTPVRRHSREPAIGSHPELKRIENELRSFLQTDVAISIDDGERGSLSLAFYSADDLERLVDAIMGPHRERL